MNEENADNLLNKSAKNLKETLFVFVSKKFVKILEKSKQKNIEFIALDDATKKTKQYFFIEINDNFYPTKIKKISKIKVKGMSDEKAIFEQEISFPNRGDDVVDFYVAYSAWKLSQFIDLLCLE
jgi:hypothetical protein